MDSEHQSNIIEDKVNQFQIPQSLLKQSMILSKTGAMDSSEATEKLTSKIKIAPYIRNNI